MLSQRIQSEESKYRMISLLCGTEGRKQMNIGEGSTHKTNTERETKRKRLGTVGPKLKVAG